MYFFQVPSFFQDLRELLDHLAILDIIDKGTYTTDQVVGFWEELFVDQA